MAAAPYSSTKAAKPSTGTQNRSRARRHGVRPRQARRAKNAAATAKGSDQMCMVSHKAIENSTAAAVSRRGPASAANSIFFLLKW